jgi:hypothetical protein
MIGDSVYTNDPDRIRMMSNNNFALPSIESSKPFALEVVAGEKKEFKPDTEKDLKEIEDAYD